MAAIAPMRQLDGVIRLVGLAGSDTSADLLDRLDNDALLGGADVAWEIAGLGALRLAGEVVTAGAEVDGRISAASPPRSRSMPTPPSFQSEGDWLCGVQ